MINIHRRNLLEMKLINEYENRALDYVAIHRIHNYQIMEF